MKKITLLLIIAFCSQLMVAQETCATASTIIAGTYVVDAINGTEVSTPLCAANGTGQTAAEWYAYTPTQNYSVTVTSDLTANICKDTRVHVYIGTCGTLTCVSGDDDGGVLACNSGNTNSFLSTTTFNVAAGTTYYIVWDNKWSSAGFAFQLSEAPIVIPPTGPVTFTSQNIATINSQYNLCVVDMNNDYLDDIVGVSASNIRIHSQNANGTFTFTDYPTEAATHLPSWSLAAGDYNKDGYNDLMYGGGQGLSLYKSNSTGTGYTKDSATGQYIFCQRTNFIDINNDGNLDAFSCHDVDPNTYYLNNGAGVMTFYQSNVTPGAIALGIHPDGGNYGSIWIDYDNDGDQDLFIAKCRGGSGTAKYNELHRNNGNGTFSDVSVAANMYDPVQTWSSAWADYDNDGDMDALVGASSTADGSHKYMRNNGNGTFTDMTVGTGWDTNTATNIEHIAYDFDNNGFVDVMGGGNKIMYNQGDGTFVPFTHGFGVSAVGDLNNDGFLDFQSGTTLRISSGNTNKWLKINLRGIQSNRNGIGARIEIYGTWGKQIRDVRSGEGFKYMSTLNTHFGIGQATEITQVIIKWPSGLVDTFNNVTPNQSLTVVEGSTLSNNEFTNANLSVFPIPAKNVLNIKNNSNLNLIKADVFDMNGRKVISSTPIENNQIRIESLQTGTYILMLFDSNQKTFSQKITVE
jgi:hypothetical protein